MTKSRSATAFFSFAFLALALHPVKGIPAPHHREHHLVERAADAATQKSNALAAQKLNTGFQKLNENSSCKDGEMACVSGQVAQCAGGFKLTACAGGTSCFALPLVNKEGTTITCDTAADAEARFQAAGVQGTGAGDNAAGGDNAAADNSTDGGAQPKDGTPKKSKQQGGDCSHNNSQQTSGGGSDAGSPQDDNGSNDGGSSQDGGSNNDGSSQDDGGNDTSTPSDDSQTDASTADATETETASPTATPGSSSGGSYRKRQIANVSSVKANATPPPTGQNVPAGSGAPSAGDTNTPVAPTPTPVPAGGNTPQPTVGPQNVPNTNPDRAARTVTVTVTAPCGGSSPSSGSNNVPIINGGIPPNPDAAATPISTPVNSGTVSSSPVPPPAGSPVDLGSPGY